MNIPKVFGNKIVLTVVAAALILIVIISLINTGNMAFTGYASKNSKNNQHNQNTPPSPPENNVISNNTPQENTNTNNNHGGSAFSIIIGPPENNQSSNFTNISSTPTKQYRGTNSGKQSSGGSHGRDVNPGNPNNPFYNYTNNSNISMGNHFKGKITGKMKNNLRLRRNGMRITDGEEFEGEVRINLDNTYDEAISAFDINFTTDVDLSDIVADSDNESGKAFMHSTSGVLKNIDLYVPRKTGDIAVIVCSGASDYDEIYDGCPNEELLYINNSRIEVSSDGLYYIVHNITGTGATGVNVTEINSTHQNPPPPGSLEATAGNITGVRLPGGSGTTQSWAGYFGNITGTIQLADSSDYVLYNWSLASPEGEIFASTNNSIIWNFIQCLNFNSDGTYEDIITGGVPGGMNLHGTNLTQLETQYGIRFDDLDGVDETFNLTGAGTHDVFYVNANEFSEGECYNTRVYDSSGAGVDNHFEEVLLYEPMTSSVIFASLLNEDLLGFDNKEHDFEMLVLENGHGTDTMTTTYYFYAVMF